MGINIVVEDLFRDAVDLWRPPKRMTGTQWADEHFYLSPESAAEPGKWKTIAYQREPLNCMTDSVTETVTWMKSARVGYTKLVGVTLGFFADNDPCPMTVVQPTIEDAEDYSKDEIATMIRDVPVLKRKFKPSKAKDGDNTIIKKSFPGGSLNLIGANSPRGFRRVSRRVMIFDEVDGYPPSAGAEGDQIKLGIKRTELYWNRKIILGSTPTEERISRIAKSYEDGDQRRYFVPCPHCKEKQVLSFKRFDWNHTGVRDPWTAMYRCEHCEQLIDHKFKRWMIDNGEWRAAKPFKGHASFHLWTGYSLAAKATWGHIAFEFEEAQKNGVEDLKTFVMTTLGETWKDKGEAPDWQTLFNRREPYAMGTAPMGVRIITAGVDVQQNRLVYEIVGWGEGKETWSIDAVVLPGDTSKPDVWNDLATALDRPIKHESGQEMRIAMMAVDSGYNTQNVYAWCRRYPKNRVIAVKGKTSGALTTLVSAPTAVDVTIGGKKMAKGYQVWPAVVSIAKGELYGWLRQPQPDASVGELPPPGYAHFPEYSENYFKELTAEELIQRKDKKGYTVHEWHVIPNRENHFLDCRIYARVAAAVFGIDRFKRTDWAFLATHLGVPGRPKPPPPAKDATSQQGRPGFIPKRGADWLKPKR